jgi:hypothetical protein
MPGLSDAVRVIEPGKTRSIVAPPIDSPDAKAGQRRVFRFLPRGFWRPSGRWLFALTCGGLPTAARAAESRAVSTGRRR